VLIHTHSWKLAAGLLHTKSKYTDFLPHYQFIFENKMLQGSEAAAPLEKEARGCHPPEEFWVHLLQ
jgi:hypothetical protein